MKGRLIDAITLEASCHYDLDAATYRKVDRDPSIYDSPIARQLRGLCSLEPLTNVAELGVGTGRYFPSLRGSGTFWGVDISAEMLGVAAARRSVLLANGFTQVELRQADLLAFARLTALDFDFIYAIGVLGYHLPLTGAVLKAVRERLTPGGYFFVTTVQKGPLLRLRKVLRRWAWRCGLKASAPLSSYCCPPEKYPRLAREAALKLVAVYIWPSVPWNGLPQCGALFQRPAREA